MVREMTRFIELAQARDDILIKYLKRCVTTLEYRNPVDRGMIQGLQLIIESYEEQAVEYTRLLDALRGE